MDKIDEKMEVAAFLEEILIKLRVRLEAIDQSLLAGQKDIERMHDYYWENYAEMDQYGYEDYDKAGALKSDKCKYRTDPDAETFSEDAGFAFFRSR